jgi:hypothetical protein
VRKFEIYFHGLICFYAPEPRSGRRDYRTLALIVPDGDHTRKVITRDDEVTFNKSIETNLPPGTIFDIDDDIQNFVPHLGDDHISKSHVVVTPEKAIQLKLPGGGRLEVADFYQDRGTYKDVGVTVTTKVGRITLLTVMANDLTITADDMDIDVPVDAPWVAILNSSSHGGSGTTLNHFHRYAHITNGGLADIAEVEDLTDSGRRQTHGDAIDVIKNLPDLKGSGPAVITQTQCSNTNWP